MSAEDDFIYNFIHYAMHYRNGGIGVKHVTDFYVIMQKNPALDFEYIERELDKLGVLQFWKNTKRLLDVWFNSAESDDISDFLTTKIFNSGAYGTAEGKMNSEAVRISGSAKSAKLKVIMNVIFPTYKAMCQKYPFLKKAPVLLPFMWVFRWIVTLFQPSKIRAQKRNVDILSRESINNYHDELRYVGLDLNFE